MNRRQFLLAAPTAAAALGIAARLKSKPQTVWISGLEERIYGHAFLRAEGFEYNYAFIVNSDASEWRRERPRQAKELFISKDKRLLYRGIDHATYKWWYGDTGKIAEAEYFRGRYEACV